MNKIINYKIIILCTLFSLYISSITQVYIAKADELVPHYFNVLYNSFNGLPTSEANDIQQTQDGQIWIASYSSLIRYNGREFISYADKGISSVLTLFEDSEGRLWIGTNNDGIVLYDNKDNDFTYISEDHEIPSFSTRAISETSTGTIVVGTSLGLYQVMPDFSIKIIEDERLKDVYISELVGFGNNKTFGITKAGDLFILDGSEIITYISVKDFPYDTPISVLSLTDDEGQYFLIGTNHDYILEMRENGESNLGYSFDEIPTKGLSHINTMMLDSLGKVWIGANTAVGCLDLDDKAVTILDYVSISAFESIFEDDEGNFCLASDEEGVLKLTLSQFHNISTVLSNLTQINGVEIVENMIYIDSPDGIDIISKDTNELIENELTNTYSGESFRCVEKDSSDNLWFSSYSEDRLIKYNPKTEKITPINGEDGLNSQRIRSTMIAADGRIWVATGDGVFVLDNDEVVAHFDTDDGLKNLEILSISEDPEGKIFVGTDGAGVYVIENDEITRNIARNEGLRSDIILRTETDPINGGTWIVSGNSIAFLDPKTEDLRIIDNFPYSNNFDILFHEDIVVVLSSNGVYFATHDDMMSGDKNEFSYLYKNHLDGLFSMPVANSFSKIEDGILYLCGYQNLTMFDMDGSSSVNDFVPSITLPQIFANEASIKPLSDGSYFLPSTANYLELDMLIPTYSLNTYNIVYWIENYDENTHKSSYQSFNNPTYTNLPGGTYNLHVQLTDSRTDKIMNTETFKITKEFTILENPTFRGFATYISIILLVGFSHFAFKKRVEKIKEQEELATNMFHDTVELLSKVIDTKDKYTTGHSKRVANYSRVIAKAMSYNEEEEESVYGIALLHDLGKITIPDEVLNKPGKLNDYEFTIMKSHASNGADILGSIHSWPDLTLGAKYHHERYDGKGYPDKLAGEDIPQIARIICVADSFDAMYSSRVYRKKLNLSYVLEELEKNAGTQFDPEIVSIFVNLIRTGQLDELLDKMNPN